MSNPKVFASLRDVAPEQVEVTCSDHAGTAAMWLGHVLIAPVRDDEVGTIVDDLETIAAIGQAITRQAERKMRELRNGDTDGIPDPCGGGSLPSAADDGPEAA